MAHTRWARARTTTVLMTALAATSALGLLAPPAAHAAADGCAVGVESDFNADGYADAVVGDPTATVAGQIRAGRVIVLYGDSDGRIGEGARGTVSQGSGSVAGVPESGDYFGFAIAAADLDCDGSTDLVVGTPFEDVGGTTDSGYVQVIWGAAAGLGTGTASVQYTQTSFGAAITAGDQFGYAVDALEDLGQGGTPAPDAYAIAIGAPGRNVGGDDNAGLVGLLVAYDGGNESRQVTQDTPGIPGAAEAGDRFGAAVTLNYLAGESDLVDVAVGVPNENIGAVADAGAVTLVRDVYFEELGGGLGYDQSSPGVPGAVEAGDRFGYALDSVRVGSTTRLAVGAPYEDIGSDTSAGAVQFFSSNATTITPGSALNQDTAGVSGVAEAGDTFGYALAFAAPGLGDTATRLAVGTPGEDGTLSNSGTVQVFPVTDLDAEVGYSQNSPGVPGAAEAGDRFGADLAAVEGPAERALLVGVADDVTNASGMVDVIPFGGGAPRSWVPGVAGVPGAGSSRFGATLASSGF